MAFDSKCCDLARLFLQDETDIPTAMEIAILAQAIQDTIEDWLTVWRGDYAKLREGTAQEPAP